MGSKTLGWVLLGAGAAAVTVGAVVAVRSRKRQLSGSLGRVQERVQSGGMTLTHHRSEKLPIDERIAILQDLTHKSVQDPQMRKLALQITRHCPARDGECEAKAIYGWMKKNIRYTGDVGPLKLGRDGPVEAIDLFQHAARTVEFGGGDCDDHSILGCTLAAHNGLTCKYRVTSPNRRRRGRNRLGKAKADDYTHIYAMVGLPKNNPRKWVALDSTLPGRKRYAAQAPYGKHLDYAA